MIRVENLSVRIGEKPLLQDVSFTLEAGTLLAVLGPNGAGKSTLLKCLAGERHPTEGRVLVDGEALHSQSPREVARWRGVLPQVHQIPFAFTAQEIVLLGRAPHIRSVETSTDYDIVREALAATDSTHLASRTVDTLSGGELQRIHLARVLTQIWEPHPTHPRLLLLDEPTSALDLKHQHSLLMLVRQFATKGSAVLVVLHDLNLASRYADEILLLHETRVAGSGRPHDVFTPDLLSRVFGIHAHVLTHPSDGSPVVLVEPADSASAMETHTDNAHSARQTPC